MSPDPNTALLEAMASGNPPSMAELVARLGESDPRMALVGQFLVRRQQAEREADAAPPATTTPDDAGRRKALRELRQLVNDMYQELDALRTRNGELAAALGACPLCWSDDPDCSECGGNGRPGWQVPDRRLFARYVAPAARRLQPRPAEPRPNG